MTDGNNNPLDGDVKLYQYEDGKPTKITKERIKNGKNFYICVPTDKNVTSINVSMKTEETEMSTGAKAKFLLLEPKDPKDKEYQNFIMADGKPEKKKQFLSTTFSASKGDISKNAFIVKRDSMNGEPLKGAKFIIVKFGCSGTYEEGKNKGSYVHISSFEGGADKYLTEYKNKYGSCIGEYVYIGSQNMEEFRTNYAANKDGNFDVFKKEQIYRENGKDQKDASITWTDIKNNPSAYQKYIYETNEKGEIVINDIEGDVRYYVMEIEAPPGYTIDHPNEWSKPILTDSDKKISYGYEWDGVITNSCKR